jgi:metal-sulfur cluster biosynthetic enzyme
MDQNDILEVLRRVQHPETGTDLVSQGMIENLIVTGDKTLAFSRSRDPFAASLKKACETILSETFPQYAGHISVFIKEAPPKKIEPKKPEPGSWTGGISRPSISSPLAHHVKIFRRSATARGLREKSPACSFKPSALSVK